MMGNATDTDRRSVLKEALAAIDTLQHKLDAVERSSKEPIAIIGIGCRFPGGVVNAESFWRVMRDGVDATTEIPADRWPIEDYYHPDPDAPGKMYMRRGGFLDCIDRFDPHFFGIAPREARSMDPQQRLLLEVAWETLEFAGQDPDRLIGSSTGVFIGITTNDYGQLLKARNPENLDAYHLTGNHLNFAAGRLSFFLGVQGPAITVDTACSSSLVSTHLACQSLRSRECDFALAGGVNLLLSPYESVTTCKARMLAVDGRCKTFDARADGFARGEGCGLLALKRLSDAVAQGDTIYALIRGSAVNQDGASSGLTVPNAMAQRSVIRQALQRAGIRAHQVSYIEAHGTGTALGDPIEVRSLNAVLGKDRPKDRPFMIGTVKTNIGHLESAAGVAGLIKVVLALQHREIPPLLHLQKLNPAMDWSDIPAIIPTERTAWQSDDQPLIAGVNSFGGSGTNAHMILQEAPQPPARRTDTERPLHLLALSAKTPAALCKIVQRYRQYFKDHPTTELADVGFTANAGRKHFACRQAFVADTPVSMGAALETFSDSADSSDEAGPSKQPQIAFLFTGQGSQYVGMGRVLYDTQPSFRKVLKRCEEILRPQLEQPLLSVLYPEAGQSSPLDETAYTQPALFALEYALATLWQSWGIKPAFVMGHSVGEYVAACVAGVMSLEDGLSLIATRARLMNALPRKGAMAAVMADEQRVASVIEQYSNELSIAAANEPVNVVISGVADKLQSALAELESAAVKAQVLNVSHAFHSPLMEPILESFEAGARKLDFSSPQIPMISNVSGRFFGLQEIPGPEYWRRHIQHCVRFSDGMRSLAARDCDGYLELGPHPVLVGMGRQCVEENMALWLPSLRKGRNDWQQMLESLSGLYAAGVPIDWRGFDRDYDRRRMPLPNYPFMRKRYWAVGKTDSPRTGRPLHPVLQTCVRSPLIKGALFEGRLGIDALPYLADHRIHGMPVLPATAYMEAAFAAARQLLGNGTFELQDLILHQALVLPEDDAKVIQCMLTPTDSGWYDFRLISLSPESQPGSDSYTLHAEGRLRGGTGSQEDSSAEDQALLAQLQQRCEEPVPAEEFYKAMGARGFDFGSRFRGLENLWRGKNEALGQVRMPEDLESEQGLYGIHPAILDACLQVFGATWPNDGEPETFLPFSMESFRLVSQPPSPLWSHAILRPGAERNRETWCGDLRLFDATGQIVAQLKGLIVKRSNADALHRFIQGDSEKLLYEVHWQRDARERKTPDVLSADFLPTPDQLAAGVQSKVAELAADNHIGTYEALFPQMDALCIAFVAKTLRDLGWQPEGKACFSLDSLARQLGVIDQHRRLLGRFMEMLEEDGYIEKAASDFKLLKVPAVDDPEEQLATLLKRYPEADAELTLTGHFGRHMAAALRGEMDAVQLLFPDGSLEPAERLYQNSPYFRFYNCLIQAAVAEALVRLPAGRSVRILEIGAGTGGTTYRVLQQLPEEQTEYLFTDVSNLFLAKARAKFQDYPFVRYQLLDIEQDPAKQGLASHSFDLILASNVLHATADLRKTMRHVKRLLAAQGLLIMLEATRPQRFGDLIVGLTEGWWKFADSDLRPSHALMTRDSWLRLISDAGFEAACTLKSGELESGVFSSQAVILARGAPLEKESAQVSSASIQNKDTWVIFSDKTGVGASLADHLASSGQSLCRVEAGADFANLGSGRFCLNPAEPTDFQRLFDLLHGPERSSPSRVVYLWALDVDLSENTDPVQLEAGQKLVCGAALTLVQTLAKADPQSFSGLWLVTQGAQAIGLQRETIAPAQSSLWGFGRTVAIEHPQMKCVLVDLDVCDPQAASQILADELDIGHGATQVAWRDNSRYAARLTRRTSVSASQAARKTANLQPVKLVSTTPGILDGLQLQALTRRPPNPGEVEIEVRATGLNFRDVLMAMGMYPGGQDVLGVECSGKVAAIGDRVKELQVGDDVVGIAAGGFGTYATTDARLVARLPQGLGFEAAATIPSAFLTADFTLNHLARISSGDRVLIHAAAGGVGMAALQLAKRAGAVIYATAGSDEKRALIRSLGVEQVMDSRSLAFAEEIMAATDEAGVDVVLNSLSGEFISKSLSVVRHGGIFLEIGRREIWDAGRVAEIRPDVSYFTVNLMEACHQEPAFIGKRLVRLMDAFGQGRLEPLPRHVYPLARAADAFRFMAQAKHKGKIVIVHPTPDASGAALAATGGQAVSISGQGAYLITGGLGGLGLQVANWLVQRGARHLLLMGRSAPSQEAQEIIKALSMAGASVQVARGDIANANDLEQALAQTEGHRLQLKGVFHCAGLLADGVLAQQDWQRFAHVMAPKVAGLWNLHRLTRHLPLEVFVIFSSAVSLLGSAGQANHASACAFEDALAHYRRARGLPAVSINWGPWSSVGSVVTHQVGDRLMSRGIQTLSPNESLHAMEQVLDQNPTQVMILRADWKKFVAQFPADGIPSIFKELTADLPPYVSGTSQRKSPDLLTRIEGAKPGEIRNLLQDHIRQVVIQVLDLESTYTIDLRQGLRDIGMDSLMSLELRNRLQASSGQSLPSTLAFDCPTVEALADYLSNKLSAATPVQAKAVTQQMDRSGSRMAQVQQLSEEEAEALLLEELSKGKPRKSI